MNIAIFASAFHPHVGGVEELCRQLAHEYRSRQLGTAVFTERWPRTLPEYEEFEGIPIHRLPFRVPSDSLRSNVTYLLTHGAIRRRLVRLLKHFDADVLHVQCVSNNAFYAIEAQSMLRLPLVLTMQGELTMDAQQRYQRSEQACNILRTGLRCANAITACSRQTLAEGEAFYGRSLGDRARVVYNGISSEDALRVVPFKHLRPYIFAIGRHVQQKGFDVLLHAFKLLNDEAQTCDLILAGAGPEHETLKALALNLGLNERVLFPGRVDHATAMNYFAGCEAFVLPSRHEPFGIVNLEAMAVGKPVVASRVGGVPEIVCDNDNGLLVPPEDPLALTIALQRLLGDERLRHRLGNAGRERARQFTWSQIADKYLEMYRLVASRSHATDDIVLPAMY